MYMYIVYVCVSIFREIFYLWNTYKQFGIYAE